MRPPWLFALLFASLCPFYAFGFPSVSPFWGASNLDWLNELRSDYPLNSTCFEWSYFGRGPHRNAVCVSLPSNDSASLNRCSWGFPISSRWTSREVSMHPFKLLAHVLPIRAQTGAPRLPFAVSCSSSKTVAQRSVARGFVVLSSRPGFSRRAWRSCARRCGPIAEARCRTCGEPMSL
jgi:hypothetical protein